MAVRMKKDNLNLYAFLSHSKNVFFLPAATCFSLHRSCRKTQKLKKAKVENKPQQRWGQNANAVHDLFSDSALAQHGNEQRHGVPKRRQVHR